MKKIKYILLLTICTAIGSLYFGFADSTQETVKAQQKPKGTFALLVGINQYKAYPGSKKVRDLSGTNNDVELMRKLLGQYGFLTTRGGDTQLITLLNDKATQEGIRNSFRTYLIDYAKDYKTNYKVEPKDGATVVFYYSGHGAKLPDQPNGDEIDGIDETIVPHDSDTDGSKDIRDDEFDEWINELKQYTTNITLIFDSCHSGTIARGGVSKSVKRDVTPTNNAKGNGLPRDGMLRGESYVAISGSLPKEESQEDVFPDPDTKEQKWNGALTYSLVHLLRRSPNLTYREAMRQVQTQVMGMGKSQTPQVEGDIDRQIFGSSDTRKETPIFIESAKVVEKNIDKEFPQTIAKVSEITMKVGSIVGAGNGATFVVLGKKKGSEVIGKIGSGIIIDPTDEFTSTGEVSLDDKSLDEKSMVEVLKSATVKMTSYSYSRGGKQIVGLDFPVSQNDASLKIFSELEKKLTDHTMLKPIKEKNLLEGMNKTTNKSSDEAEKIVGEWNVAIVRAKYKDFKDGNPQAIVKRDVNNKDEILPCAQKRFIVSNPQIPGDDEEGFFISDRVGKPLYNLWYSVKDEKVAECLTNALEKHVRIESLRQLTTEGSALNDGLKVEFVRLKRDTFKVIDRNKPLCNIEPVTDNQREIDQKTLMQLKPGDFYYLKITNNTPQELYVYIYSLTTTGQITMLYPNIQGAEKGEILPPTKTIQTNLTVGKYGNCYTFFIEPPELSPPGMETIKVIASTQDFPGKMLEQPGVGKGLRGFGLIQLFKQLSTGARSNAFSMDINDMTVKDFKFQIVPVE